MRKNTPEGRLIASRLWSEGNNVADISKIMGINRNLISKMLKHEGVDVCNKASSENKLFKGVERDVFSDGTEASDYFLGFILADGCISRDRLILEIQERDSHILDRLVTHLDMDINVRSYMKKGGTRASYFAVRSERICQELSRYGIVPNKTGTESCPPGFERNRDFWRGVVDGDGCITIPKGNHPRVYLCGTEKLCQQFLEYCDSVSPSTKTRVIPAKNIFRVTIAGRRSLEVLDALYSDSNVRLDRKYLKYEETQSFYQERCSKP